MATILVAASPEPRSVIERILAGHELFAAETMAQAQKLLSERSFDLIICTIMFDESHMFDFLWLVKSTPQWERIRFVCARAQSSAPRLRPTLEAAAFTCRELGADAFLDIENYATEREMRDEIEKLLGKPA